MRKLLILLYFTVVLSSCGGKSNDEFKPFEKSLKDFKIEETSGYRYESVQKLGSEELNKDVVTVKIDSKTKTGIKTIYQKELADLSNNEPFVISNKTYYYKQNQEGLQDGDNITWRDQSFADFIGFELPILTINAKMFSSYEITSTNGIHKLTGLISDPNLIFTSGEVSRLEVSIYLNEDLKLSQIHMEIRSLETIINLSYQVYYQIEPIVIP